MVALKKHISAVFLLGSLTLALTPAAKAQLTLTFAYNGNTTTTFTATMAPGPVGFAGSFNTRNSYNFDLVNFNGGTLRVQPRNTALDGYIANNGTLAPFNGQTFLNGTFVSGSGFFIDSLYLGVPAYYSLTSGAGFTSETTFHSATLVDFGFASNAPASGSYDFSGMTVNWSTTNASAIPEPSTYVALFGFGALGLAVYARRYRRVC